MEATRAVGGTRGWAWWWVSPGRTAPPGAVVVVGRGPKTEFKF
jgi:hypothetical protein